MSAKTDYLETALLNNVLRGIVFTPPTFIYIGLFTVSPGESGGGTEVSGGAYVRKQVDFDAPVSGVAQNSAPGITFPAASASWGEVVAMALFDAATGGNMLYYGPLTEARTVEQNDVFQFPAGALNIQER